MIVDSHAHLQWPALRDDLAGVLARARAAGVARTVVVGTDIESSRAAAELAAREPGLFATAGIHPCSARDHGPGDFERLEALHASGAFVAVGETGLDQHHRGTEDRAEQLDWFHFQLDLAVRLDRPVVIHCRKAFTDVVDCLAAHPRTRGVLHCFSEGPSEQEVFLAHGLYVSFAGPVTRPGARRLRAAARATPLERLLVETDSPFLPPHGAPGGANEPAGVRAVLETLAELREESFDDLARATAANAARLFGLDPPA